MPENFRTVARLKEGEREALSGGTMLHKAWNFPESSPRLDREAHVHTGEEAIKWDDRGIKVGRENTAHIVKAGRYPAQGPPETPTARPTGEAHSRGKLDRLGVNTGSAHLSWDDGMDSTKGMEDSYSLGSSPVREDTSPLANVGLLASVGSAVVPKGTGNAHSFFEAHLRLLAGRPRSDANQALGAARKMVDEADRASARAKEMRDDFAKKERAAEAAERQADEVRNQRTRLIWSDKFHCFARTPK